MKRAGCEIPVEVNGRGRGNERGFSSGGAQAIAVEMIGGEDDQLPFDALVFPDDRDGRGGQSEGSRVVSDAGTYQWLVSSINRLAEQVEEDAVIAIFDCAAPGHVDDAAAGSLSEITGAEFEDGLARGNRRLVRLDAEADESDVALPTRRTLEDLDAKGVLAGGEVMTPDGRPLLCCAGGVVLDVVSHALSVNVESHIAPVHVVHEIHVEFARGILGELKRHVHP